MTSQNKILVLGGDERQKELQKILLKKKFLSTHIFSNDSKELTLKRISEADIIILPLPVTKNGKTVFCLESEFDLTINELLEYISPTVLIIGGMILPETAKQLEEKKCLYYDILSNKSFVSYNSYLTAQGAVKLLLENANDYFVSKKALVTGYGSVSKALVYFLKGIGTDVYVAARKKEDRTDAKCKGLKTIEIQEIDKTVYLFDFIFNTVPSNIFGGTAVKHIKNESIYFELASSPFGAKKEDFEKYEKNYIPAPQLPGRFYPKQCANAIFDTVKDFL